MTRPLAVIYIAGPLDAPTHWEREANIHAAETLALAVWQLGLVAVCPHANARHFYGMLPEATFLAGGVALLRRCDAVLCTADWSRSPGAREELADAEAHDIPIFFSLADLRLTLLFRELRRVVEVAKGKVVGAIVQPERPGVDDFLTNLRTLAKADLKYHNQPIGTGTVIRDVVEAAKGETR